ncbi:MAG: helix-turn-helix transcriptional regulator [Oscillospiraceae bacterium]|nr:helix-turn-helix transcriptional regulator [Oscillospiraceae bacterium]
MISYDKLWETMARKKATTYTLQVKGGISSSTIRRLKANESVSTNTLDALCTVLGCKLHEIIEFIPESHRDSQ